MLALRYCLALLPALSLGGGCSPLSMAKRGLTELKGASGKVMPIQEASQAFYRSTGALKIGSVVNTIGPVCPASMHVLIDGELKRQAAEAAEDLPGTEVCTAEVEITYNQPPKGVQALIGKGAILLGRARLFDEQRAMRADLLIGVFSRAVRTTESEMAAVFGKTLADHVVEQAD